MRYEITAPVSGFTGDSAGASFVKGVALVDGDTAAGRAQLNYFRSSGYGVRTLDDVPAERVPDEGDVEFDPAQHGVDDVLDYLASVTDDEEETARVIEAERNGKARKTILERSTS
ncbi:hypothetical protein ACIPY6_02905 [Streptomyces sp. NPDC090054]|uniref:hypothetical protein n=1 Tax=Streptomyces sp. NPDC090054 TaxID=3365933 RepID=UPI0038161C63